MARVTLRLPDEVHNRLVARSRASGASLNQTIVQILSDALGCGAHMQRAETTLEAERRQIREALGDLVIDFHAEDCAPLFPHRYTAAEREAILTSIPVLDPPLSRTIIEDREDRV